MDEIKEIKETKHESPKTVQKTRDTTKAILIVVAILVVIGGVFVAGKSSARKSLRGQKFTSAKAQQDVGAGCPFHDAAGRGQVAKGAKVAGEITKIDTDTLTVKTTNSDLGVSIVDETSITNSQGISKKSDLKVGDEVLITGDSRSDGTVTATKIRINN